MLFQHLLEIEKDVMSYPITDLMTQDASEKEVPKMVAKCKERIVESKHQKVMGKLDDELGIGSHQNTSEAKKIPESWASKVSEKKPLAKNFAPQCRLS